MLKGNLIKLEIYPDNQQGVRRISIRADRIIGFEEYPDYVIIYAGEMERKIGAKEFWLRTREASREFLEDYEKWAKENP